MSGLIFLPKHCDLRVISFSGKKTLSAFILQFNKLGLPLNCDIVSLL